RVVDLQVARDADGLGERLSADRPDVRARAAFALGSVQSRLAVPALIRALSDSVAAVRRDAAFALGQAGSTGAVSALGRALESEQVDEVRHRILEALGKLPSVESISILLDARLTREEEPDRALALARLGAVKGMATKASQDYLLAHLDDPDPQVRQDAAYYFGRLPVAGPWSARAPRVREALDSYAKDDPAAMYLVEALGKLGEPFDGGRLRDWAVHARDWRIRVNAMEGFTRPRMAPDTREVLYEGLNDPSLHVAVAAARALSRGMQLPSELPRIESWIEGHPERWQVAGPLLTLLARMDEREFVFDWIDALPPDDQARWGVGLDALAYLSGSDARARLEKAATSAPPRIAGQAVGALAVRWRQEKFDARIHPFYFGVFSRALRSHDPGTEVRAAGALADSAFLSLGSVDTLVAAYRDMTAPGDLEAMGAVMQTLGALGAPDGAEALLRRALTDANPTLRVQAAAALSTATGTDVTPPDSVDDTPEGGASGPGGTDPGRIDWAYLDSLGASPRLVLETDQGRVVIRMDTEEAPHTVQTVARFAEGGRYDGVPFHRVVPNFVVQGGDIVSGDGFGVPGFTITSELTLIPFLRGVVGMASAGKDTEASQFFMTHSMQPHLDGGYTSFGWVVEGMDVVDLLQVGNRILRATVERDS
ncbi:MAG: peptidylprolyl isomerase, partial [Gemmatimonadota bacterium]